MSIIDHEWDRAKWLPSPNKSGLLREGRRFIVMHYTAGWNATSAINTFLNRQAQVSAHVVIDRDGSVTQMVKFNERAWHAGRSAYDGVNDLNWYSIGFEFVNIGFLYPDGSGGWIDPYKQPVPQYLTEGMGLQLEMSNRVGREVAFYPYTLEQYEAADALVDELIQAYPLEDVTTHEAIDLNGWKTDPGPMFDLERYKAKFGKAQ